jgi:shikimate kinase
MIKSKAELLSEVSNNQLEKFQSTIDSTFNIIVSGSATDADTVTTASFGSAIFGNLPTVEPLTTGSLFVSGSGGVGSAQSGSGHVMVSGIHT